MNYHTEGYHEEYGYYVGTKAVCCGSDKSIAYNIFFKLFAKEMFSAIHKKAGNW